MFDDVEPVPALHVKVACVLPAAADMPVGADGGGNTGVTLNSALHVVPDALLAPT